MALNMCIRISSKLFNSKCAIKKKVFLDINQKISLSVVNIIYVSFIGIKSMN